MTERRAAFWIAHGNSFVREAARSARSFEHHHPRAKRWLFADKWLAPDGRAFTDCVKLPERENDYWFLDATRFFVWAYELHLGGEYDKIIYFDTDTHACRSLDGLWTMLDKFDFCGAYAPGRNTVPRLCTDIPDAFPEINIGVLGIRCRPEVETLLRDWLARYESDPQRYGNNDQAPLREALWHNHAGVRIGILPMEYNLRFGFGTGFRSSVKVLHGRDGKQGRALDEICEKVNENPNGFRCWKRGELG